MKADGTPLYESNQTYQLFSTVSETPNKEQLDAMLEAADCKAGNSAVPYSETHHAWKAVTEAEAKELNALRAAEIDTFINKLKATTYTEAVDELYRKRLLELLPRIKKLESIDTIADPKKGSAALHYACGLGYIELVQWLLDHGANPAKTTVSGATPFDCAGGENAEAIRQLLQSITQ